MGQATKSEAKDAEKRANAALAAGDYEKAAPDIRYVLNYIETLDDPELLKAVRPKVERLEFLFAFCHVAKQDYPGAIKYLNGFMEKYPASERRQQALTLAALAYTATEQWGNAAKTMESLLVSGSMDRGERLEVHMALATTYSKMKKYEDALPHYKTVIQNAVNNPALRMTAISGILDAILALRDTALLYELVPLLQGGDSPVKNSLRFNLQAIEAADRLIEAEDYFPALVLLKFCKPIDEIKAGLRSVNAYLEWRQDYLTNAENAAMNYLQQIISVNNRLQLVQAEIVAADQATDYDEALRFRVAQVLMQMEMYYESYVAFIALGEDYPDSPNAPGALFATATIAAELGLKEKALELGEELIDRYPAYEKVPETIFSMAYIYQADGNINKMLALLNNALEKGLVTRTEVDRGQTYYLIGYANLFLDRYNVALDWFDKVRKEAPNSGYAAQADYWTAYITLFSDQYAEAVTAFDAFLQKYPRSAYYEDATYRISLAKLGVGDLEGAKIAGEGFVNNYPDSALRGEAYSVLGDVYGGLGMLDDSINAYELVEAYTDRKDQVHAAVFNAGRVMAADARWEQVIDHFQRYLNRYGKDAKYTMAVYKMGDAMKNLGQVDRALGLYWQTFRRFANDPDALGADLILRDYVEQFKDNHVSQVVSEKAAKRKAARESAPPDPNLDILTEEARKALDKAAREEEQEKLARDVAAATREASRKIIGQLSSELNATPTRGTHETKRLRLQYALSLADESFRVPATFSKAQVAAGTPLTLEWMAGILRKRGINDRAALAYERIINDFPQTDSTGRAYLGLGETEMALGNKEKALSMFNTVYDLYPTSEIAGTSLMRMADDVFEKKQYAAALEKYEEILMVREWRGPLWPEALYKMGLCELEKGNVAKAFAYFQRVYVMYAQHLEWTAKAYLESGKCLEKLDRKLEARRTYEEMLANRDLADTDEGREAEERLAKLPPPPAEVPDVIKPILDEQSDQTQAITTEKSDDS